MWDPTIQDDDRERRVAARFPIDVIGQLMVPTPSGLLRRRRPTPVEVTVADISVTGAAVRGADASPLVVVERGQRLAFTLGGHGGMVEVRRVGRGDGSVLLGLDFLELSPSLEELVFSLVRSVGDTRGNLEAFWASAR